MAQDYVQIALEESPRYEGAVTTAPYRISTSVAYLPVTAARLDDGRGDQTRRDELRGIEDGGYSNVVEQFEPAGSLSMRLYMNQICHLLSLNGWSHTYTAGDGIITDPDSVVIPATANRWVFTRRGGNRAQTGQVTLAYADEGVFLREQGVAIPQLTLNANGQVGAELRGLVLARIADPSLTPSYDASTILPGTRGDLTIDWVSGGGRISDFSLESSLSLDPDWSIGPLSGSASKFARDMLHGDDLPMVSGTINKRDIAANDWDKLLDGSTFSAKARWKTATSILATAYKYAMWVEMPACQIVEGEAEEAGGSKRSLGADYNFEAKYDTVAGYSARITVVNAVTSINTYV